MKMTPRRAVHLVSIAEHRRRGDEARQYALIRNAMHADKKQADAFIRSLLFDD